MDAGRVISDGLRSGDILWTLPLVKALGSAGRLWSVRWVERCLHRTVDLLDLRLRSGLIHDEIGVASTVAAAAPSEQALADATRAAGLFGDPATDAIAMLYWAYWHSSHRHDNQFAVSQESVFRRLSSYWGDDDRMAATMLAVEEFERTLAEANAADGASELDGPKHA